MAAKKILSTVGAALLASCGSDGGMHSIDPPADATSDTAAPDGPPGVIQSTVPISGGTMTVSSDGNRVAIADPDNDKVHIVDLVTEQVVSTIDLPAGSEPGRVAEDGAGRWHVALRGSGELLTIDGATTTTRSICAEPRGVAWQQTGDVVHVACATGGLVTVPAAGGAPVRTLPLWPNLRDVVVRNDGTLAVTRFEKASVLHVAADGSLIRELAPGAKRRDFPNPLEATSFDAFASTAWRTIRASNGHILIAHQRHLDPRWQLDPSTYNTFQCVPTPVESTVSILENGDVWNSWVPLANVSVPVDLAINPTSYEIAVVAAGQQSVVLITSAWFDFGGACESYTTTPVSTGVTGTPTSVGYRPNGALLVFYPDAAALAVVESGTAHTIDLGMPMMLNAGRALFYGATSLGLACASCHPEGRNDGVTWNFKGVGMRATPSLAGKLSTLAPYQEGADMPDLDALVHTVYEDRMDGAAVSATDVQSLRDWLDKMSAPAP